MPRVFNDTTPDESVSARFQTTAPDESTSAGFKKTTPDEFVPSGFKTSPTDESAARSGFKTSFPDEPVPSRLNNDPVPPLEFNSSQGQERRSAHPQTNNYRAHDNVPRHNPRDQRFDSGDDQHRHQRFPVYQEHPNVRPDHDYHQRPRTWIDDCYGQYGNRTRIEPVNTIVSPMTMDLLNLNKSELIFDGDSLKWFDWSMNFKSTVHDNVYLSTSQKVTELRNMLGEEPKSHVYGELWSEHTYNDALLRLQSIYGNRFKIGDAYTRWIRNFDFVRTPGDVSKFSRAVTKLVQIFRALHFDADLHSQTLLSELTRKLSDPLRKSWGRFVMTHGEPSVVVFQRFLCSEAEALRYGGLLTDDKGKRSSVFSFQTRDVHAVAVTPSHESGVSAASSKTSPVCSFCDSSHYIDSCSEFVKKSDDERLKWFLSQGRCFLCAKKGHVTAKCSSKHFCRAADCRRRHCTVLHEALRKLRNANPSTNATVIHDGSDDCTGHEVTNAQNDESSSYFQESTLTENTKIYLKIVKCRVHNLNGAFQDCFALLDDGSQPSLIDSSLADELGLKGQRRDMILKNCAKDVGKISSQKLSFLISDPDDLNSVPIRVDEAWTLQKLELPGQTIPRDDSGRPLWPHIANLNIPDVECSQIKLLIGASCKQAFYKSDFRAGPSDLPDALLTPFGWCVFGSFDKGNFDCTVPDETFASVNHLEIKDEDVSLDSMIQKFWSTEDFGCKFQDDTPLSIEDRNSLEMLDSQTKLRADGRYEVPMLFRDDEPNIKNNYFVQALPRWRSLARRLKRDPWLAAQYVPAIRHIDLGYARELSSEEVNQAGNLTHYMVHFPVFHPQKRKARAVFDNALKFHGVSLNDLLMMGLS